MESKNNSELEEASSMEEQTVLYRRNQNRSINKRIKIHNETNQNPEETETVSSTNQSKSTTKRYKGVWRKNGRWTARIRNPLTNSRIFLGKFHYSDAALCAYFSKKREFESQIRATKSLNLKMTENFSARSKTL
ncbi:hypothetical protein L1887_08231 [Cichorium endivia]|nr:hypothetical protein L1887_08231 [Cichorium endivia]